MPFHDEGAEYELDPLYNPRDRETVERYDGPRSYPNKQGEFPGIDDWARVFLPQEDDPEHVKFGKMVQLYTISAAAGHALSGPGGSPSVSNSPAPPAPSSADPASGQGPNWLDQLLKFGENLLKDKGKDLARLGLGKLYDQLTETPREALEAEILQARRERLADLRRHAKGEFTPRERQDIRRANEHILNRVATSLAMRGIQNSGAAAELIAQAEMAPFLQMQKQAQIQLDNYELQTYELARKLMGEDDNFVTDLMDILFETDNKGDGNTDGTLKKVDDAATMIQTAYSIYSGLEEFAGELES